MSKFRPNKEHSRRALIFCFHLKKTAAESHWLHREDYGERAPSQDTCERWFRRFKSCDFDTRQKGRQETRKIAKEFEVVKLQTFFGRRWFANKNKSPGNWALVNKLFSIAHERWERFRRSVDGYNKSWTTGEWKSTKKQVTFCSLGTKGSRFCIV